MLVIIAKGFLKLSNLHMLIKQNSPSLPRNVAVGTFGKLLIIVLNKSKSAIPALFSGLEVLSSASNKTKSFAENFSKNSDVDVSGISLPVSPRTNMKLHKMVGKVIMNLDLSKASAPDCILSYILAEILVSEGVLFSRLLEVIIDATWGKVCS